MRKVLLCVGLLLLQQTGAQAAVDSEYPAMQKFRDIAEGARLYSYLQGMVFAGVGCSHLTSDESWQEKNVLGVLFLGLGFYQAFIARTVSEDELERLERIRDPYQQEKAAYNALRYAANKRYQDRMKNGFFDGMFAAYYLLARPFKQEIYTTTFNGSRFIHNVTEQDVTTNDQLGLLFALLAVKEYVVPSEEESFIKDYHKNEPDEFSLTPGINSRGDCVLALGTTF